jgi:hypothetical protein
VLRRFHPNALKALRACTKAAGAPGGTPDGPASALLSASTGIIDLRQVAATA